MTISFVNGVVVEGFTEGKIPYTAKELANKRYFRKWEKKLAIACGVRCAKCGSNANAFQNKAHTRALRNAGISKVKCRCGRCL
jgi:hypothetical protein